MIRRLAITNFQSHPDTALDFAPGVNVLVGISNSGKTAILRSLLWLVEHRPLGFRFHTRGIKGPTWVEVVTSEGAVALSKTERTTEYVLGRERWPSPGDQVPEQVSQLLNFTEVNIQRQFDPHFLICSSPGEVARAINQATRLEQADEWISHITSEVNEIGRKVKIFQSDRQEVEGHLHQLEDLRLDELNQDLDIWADLSKQMNDLKVEESALEDVSRSLCNVGALAEETEKWIEELSPQLEQAQEVVSELGLLNTERNLLEETLALQERMGVLADWIEAVEPLGRRGEAVSSQLSSLSCDISELEAWEGKFGRVQEALGREQQELDRTKADLLRLLKREGRCPLCLSELSEEAMGRIMGELE